MAGNRAHSALRAVAVVGVAVLLVGASVGGALGPASVSSSASGQPLVQTCVVGPVIAVDVTGNLCSDGDPNELAQADALETKKEIYSEAATQRQSQNVTLTSLENYLGDTRSIARMEGKNAYIMALNNGSSQAAAEAAATEAVAQYYVTKQEQVVALFNTTNILWNASKQTAKNTTGVGTGFVSYVRDTRGNSQYYSTSYEGQDNANVTLVDGSTATVYSHRFRAHVDESAGTSGTTETTLTPATGKIQAGSTADTMARVDGLKVAPPNQNYDTLTLSKFQQWKTIWEEIEAQNDQVQSELETFVGETYDNYQAGEINESDLVDPYLGAREYSPESQFQSWALRSMTAMGIEPPENLSQVGYMEVTDHETANTYKGILMSQQSPAGGYTVGETYNASAINGSQFVVNETTHELTGVFTLDSATTADGEEYETNETIEYTNVTYNTTSTEEYQELQTRLNNLTAQINARQQELRNSGGGGGILPGFGLGGLSIGGLGLGLGGTVLLAGGAAYVLVGRN